MSDTIGLQLYSLCVENKITTQGKWLELINESLINRAMPIVGSAYCYKHAVKPDTFCILDGNTDDIVLMVSSNGYIQPFPQ